MELVLTTKIKQRSRDKQTVDSKYRIQIYPLINKGAVDCIKIKNWLHLSQYSIICANIILVLKTQIRANMKVGFVTIIVLAAGVMLFLFFTSYRSAFEADQACHFIKWESYKESLEFGCDHDLETNQWILYQEGSNHQPAKVVKRFRY